VSDSLRFRVPLIISSLIAGVLVLFVVAATRQIERTLVHAGEVRAQAAADDLADLLGQSALQRLSDVRSAARDREIANYLQHPERAGNVSARLATLISTGQPSVELWNGAGQRLLSIPTAAPALRTISGEPPVPPAGVSPLCVEGNVIYWRAVADVEVERPGGGPAIRLGAIVSRQRLVVDKGVDIVTRLVGGGAVVNVGNRIGSTWSDLSKVVRGPAIDSRRAGTASYRGEDGIERLGAAAPVKDLPWTVWVEFPRSAIAREARTFQSRMLAVALVVVTLSALSSFAFVARLEQRAEEARALNATLEARVAELGVLSHELEAFSYSVSHDLRAPLRQVVGHAGLLEKSAGPSLAEHDRQYVRSISEAAARMSRLIDELLTFSRMERREMLHADVDLSGLVDGLREDAMSSIGERDVIWNVHPLPVVQGDPSMLRQVFANLLSNALKYTSTRPVTRIEVGANSAPAETVIYVRDNGVGFDMQHAGRLFGVFQRLHRAEDFEGTGVGLANVRRIIARHGGRVWAEGAVDRGATFFVSLPRG